MPGQDRAVAPVWQPLRIGACRRRRRSEARTRYRGLSSCQNGPHVIDLNLTSAFLAARAVVPMMRKQRRGRIVVFSSVIADGEKGPLTTVTGRLPYATAKAALLGFTSQLAKDLIEYGITVNALMPGLILGEQGTRIRDKFDNLDRPSRSNRCSAGIRAGGRAPARRSLPQSIISSRSCGIYLRHHAAGRRRLSLSSSPSRIPRRGG